MASQPLLPPSLSRFPGVTTPGCIRPNGNPACGLEHCIDRPGVLLDECSAAGKLRQLEQAIHELPLTEGVEDRSTVAAHGDLGGRSGALDGAASPAQSGLKDKQGRSREVAGDYVGIVAALDYEKLTVSRVSRKVVPNDWSDPPAPHGSPYGEWHDFLKKVFLILGIDPKADGVNQRLQADLKADLKARYRPD